MNRRSGFKLLAPVIGCCMLLLGAQFIADLIFTVVIVSGMDIQGIPANELDAMLYEELMLHRIGIMLVAYLLTLTGLYIWARMAKKPFFEHTGLNLKTTAPIGILSLLAGIAANIWFSLMVGLFPWPASWIEEYESASSAISSGSLPLELLTVVLLAPIVEEILFRGIVYRYLSAVLPLGAAVLFQGILFGGMHGTIIWIIYAGIVGCILGYIRRRTESLHATIWMHIGFNGGAYLFSALAEHWGDNGGAIVAGLIGSAGLFLLMLYGIEYRIGEPQLEK